jgi:hypothetical protein
MLGMPKEDAFGIGMDIAKSKSKTASNNLHGKWFSPVPGMKRSIPQRKLVLPARLIGK